MFLWRNKINVCLVNHLIKLYIYIYFQWGVGAGAYSITAVRTYVPSVPYVTLLVSVRYLLKGLVYWIEILYTGI